MTPTAAHDMTNALGIACSHQCAFGRFDLPPDVVAHGMWLAAKFGYYARMRLFDRWCEWRWRDLRAV